MSRVDSEAYLKDYVPKAQAAIKAAGGKFLAAGGKTTTIEGEPPKSRVVIQQWDSLEKVQAYRNSTAFKDLQPLRDKLGKIRSFVVEGVPGYPMDCRTIEAAGVGGIVAITTFRFVEVRFGSN